MNRSFFPNLNWYFCFFPNEHGAVKFSWRFHLFRVRNISDGWIDICAKITNNNYISRIFDRRLLIYCWLTYSCPVRIRTKASRHCRKLPYHMKPWVDVELHFNHNLLCEMSCETIFVVAQYPLLHNQKCSVTSQWCICHPFDRWHQNLFFGQTWLRNEVLQQL